MTDKGGSVQSLTRALRLLQLLGEAGEGVRLSELARRAELAVSTTHRLLTTMEQSGFVHSDPKTTDWHVGREAFAVGAAYLKRRDYVAPAVTFLRQLRDDTRETANLGLLENGQLVTISQIESREITRAISPPGGRVPATCSAMGKAILATWSDDQIATFCEGNGFQVLTAKSHKNIASLMSEIDTIRKDGFALDDEEHVRGLRCVAAAVFSPDGEAVCAISVSGLASRMTAERVATAAVQVRKAAASLTRTIGG